MNTYRMSEARLNDVVYMALKLSFFEPVFFSNPRGCDIRVVMDMVTAGQPGSKLTVLSALLDPAEVAPSSHDIAFDVDIDELLDTMFTYLADHWKATINPDENTTWRTWFKTEIVPALMSTPEEDCAKQEANNARESTH